MFSRNRKIVLVGTGMVGMSYAYALLNQGACDELVLIDYNRDRAIGEAMDLNHGIAFSPTAIKIYAGDYTDCEDAALVVICAGVAQKPGESRRDLLCRNVEVFRSIVEPVIRSGFNGLFLVATNPVDVMTRVTCTLSGFNPRRVIGSGTVLDTARLRFLLGDLVQVDPRNVHAYVIGEHGDSEFVPWSQATVATRPLTDICADPPHGYCTFDQLTRIEQEVRDAAQHIIRAKNATYYGIGMSLVRITKAIFGDENSVLTVSANLLGEYGEQDVFVGVPCVVNRNGVRMIHQMHLNEEEANRFHASCDTLRTCYEEAKSSLA